MYTSKQLMQIALELAGLSEETVDTGIYMEGKNIRKVLVGIDMETPELLLGKELGVDLVVSHHPTSGTQLINFHNVMLLQIDKMVEFGIPINRAQKMLKKRMNRIALEHHVYNYDRSSSAARLLNMPYMNIHMPADLITERFVQSHINKQFANKNKTKLQDIIDSLNNIREFHDAIAKPVIRVGNPDSYAGKIAVLMAGGAGGGVDIYKAYFEAGVGTIISMHIPNEVKNAIEEQDIGNIIVAGHMASDSIGLNNIINRWQEVGIEVIKMSSVI